MGRSQGKGSATFWTRIAISSDSILSKALRSKWPFDYDGSRTETGYQVDVPVPGYKPDQVDVTFEVGALSVNGNTDRRTF